jgi:DNA repair exonuclease SbcCD nuclease subunit
MVILAGDLYDGDWVDFRTGLFVHEQLARLKPHGICVFVARGNHDAESLITRQLPEQPHVQVFRSRKAHIHVLAELGVAVHGRSFPDRVVNEDLVLAYPDPVPGCFNIGVLHTSLAGSPDHGTYASTRVDRLVATGYDHLALGHIHARQVVLESAPRIVFTGNLQGRHARETGPKGCEIVTVEHGQITHTEFVALDAVRWHGLTLQAAPSGGIEVLCAQFVAALGDLLGEGPEVRARLHVVRVRLQGQSPLHHLEASRPGSLEAALQATLLHWDSPEGWIERVVSLPTLPRDLTDAHGQACRR